MSKVYKGPSIVETFLKENRKLHQKSHEQAVSQFAQPSPYAQAVMDRKDSEQKRLASIRDQSLRFIKAR